MNTNEQLTISEKFQLVITLYPKSKLKYIHYKTVRNFIFHFEDLNDGFQKNEIAKSLNEYMELLSQSAIIDNAIEAREIFQKYLQPIGIIFEEQLNFHITMRPTTLLFFTLPLFLFLYLLKVPTGYYIGLLVLTVYIIARHIYFDRKKRIYSIMY